MWFPPEVKQRLDAAIDSFPTTFGLRAFPGDTFRIDRDASYVSDGVLMLYTAIQKPSLGDTKVWLSFAKGTPEELRREIVAAPTKESA